MNKQMKNAVRGLMVVVLTAAVTWLVNYLVDRIFGPDEIEA
jgi:VIT1/CCC1 family predicted Fe2+/Mn2+ transporter